MMQKLHHLDAASILGAKVEYKIQITVSGFSYHEDGYGYRYYADRIETPAGLTLFKGHQGQVNFSNGLEIQITRDKKNRGNVYTVCSQQG